VTFQVLLKSVQYWRKDQQLRWTHSVRLDSIAVAYTICQVVLEKGL